MKIRIVTLFPGFFEGPLRTSIVERAMSAGDLEVELIDLRSYGKGVHRQVDDAPFGGGAGMVLMVEPLFSALSTISGSHRILLTPAGARLTQGTLDRLAAHEDITLVCGRYEGVDERVRAWVDREVSIGDYVLTGGELAALVVIDAVSRLVPGVIDPASSAGDSFATGLLEHPQYTRPEEFEGVSVPPILSSGNHAEVAAWRHREALRRTLQRRPDLLAYAPLTDADRAELERLRREGSE
jgi:tRNA (guanine37-N1)-methyltransferase